MSEYDDTERGWLEGRDSRTAQERQPEEAPPSALTFDEREFLGERLMRVMTCAHGADYFGTGAVCETCWTNVQRVGRIVERLLADRLAAARREGADAALAPVEELAGALTECRPGLTPRQTQVAIGNAIAQGRDAAKDGAS